MGSVTPRLATAYSPRQLRAMRSSPFGSQLLFILMDTRQTSRAAITELIEQKWLDRIDNGLSIATIRGFQEILKKRFATYVDGRVFYHFTSNFRQLLKLRSAQKLPVILIAVESVAIIQDEINLRAVSKSGLTGRSDESLGNSNMPVFLDEIKPVPIRINAQLTYIGNDVDDILKFGMDFTAQMALRWFTFNIEYGGYATQIRVRSDEATLNAPAADQWVDLETDGQENTQAFQFPVYLRTYTSYKSKVPAVRGSKTVLYSQAQQISEETNLGVWLADEESV